MLGLKRNEVKLVSHNPEWDTIAAKLYKEFKKKLDIAAFEPLYKGWSADK